MDGHQRLKRASIMFTFVVLHLVQAQDQQGFISLDCGLEPNQSPYLEPATNLSFSSDHDFIQTGKRGKIAKGLSYEYKQYNALRYFPEGKRHCYNLSVKQDISYLIRAGFAYGNYDGKNIYPSFDIYIGPNWWATVYDDRKDFEIIHMAKSNSLQICLVQTGPTTPFISTLELRPLRNDSYSTQSGSLQLVYRHFYISNLDVRYPDDVYDRLWYSNSWFGNDAEINTTHTVNSSNAFVVPQVIARSAAISGNASEPLYFFESTDNPSDNIIIYLHFAEIQDLQANDTREFDIVWNENITNSAYTPKKLEIDTIFNTSPGKCDDQTCYMQLVRTRKSTLPPLLNAYEVYKVMELPHSETHPGDVDAIKHIQAAYKLNIISWQGDPCLPEQWKWDGVTCNYTNKSTPPRIISLELSRHGLKGIIDPALQNLTHLEKLDLSRNSLSGGVPEFLANMKSLSTLNLGWNKLNGAIPLALLDREMNGLSLITRGNSNLCDLADKCNNNNTKFVVPVVASVSTVVLIVFVLLLFLAYKKKKTSKVPRRSPITKSVILTKKRRFTYSEVQVLTNNFERVIGEGGFGVVYHGLLNDKEQVAVKVLSHSSTQGYKQFKAEVELLLRVHHTNLVNLVGYCNEEDHLALVYEYAAKGDLKQHISGESDGVALDWESRLRIVIETAQGLEYLHNGCQPPMIHRDVKTTNILLDEHLQAKLADFGLSRSFPIGVESHVSTNVAGTPGYLDPEYYRTNWLTEKSDVYSLGIVLLEMITDRPVIQQTREKPHIGEWVGLMLTKGDIESIMDPNLKGEYDSSSVWKALELAMSCVNPSSAGRPNMSQVVSELKECLIYENSRKEGRSDMDSKSSLELSTSFTAEVTPDAR